MIHKIISAHVHVCTVCMQRVSPCNKVMITILSVSWTLSGLSINMCCIPQMKPSLADTCITVQPLENKRGKK